MILVLTIVAVWFFTAWLSSRILMDAWRFEFDVKRDDRAFMRWMSLGGPYSLLLAVGIWVCDYFEHRNRNRNRNRNHDIIYPRKDKQ